MIKEELFNLKAVYRDDFKINGYKFTSSNNKKIIWLFKIRKKNTCFTSSRICWNTFKIDVYYLLLSNFSKFCEIIIFLFNESNTIPNSFDIINDYAFEQCEQLKSVIFLNESLIYYIGNFAFFNCKELKYQ